MSPPRKQQREPRSHSREIETRRSRKKKVAVGFVDTSIGTWPTEKMETIVHVDVSDSTED